MDVQTLHEALLNPATYVEKTGPIGYRETHISRLYFTTDHVYKIKKAVDFGFLNFTTLDRRRFYCLEEMRLNKRLCPDIYIDVVGIRKAGNCININKKGQIIEYAVLMKRLPEERMLDNLIRKRDPSLPEEMKRLARRIAKFHQEAEICHKNGGLSNLETMKRNWEENLDQTIPFVGKTLSEEAHQLCSTFLKRFLEKYASLLLLRETEGFIRDVHGDLHAEHICLTEPICIYDCIEFNRRFRITDIIADLAFLLMDLDFLNRRDLSDKILSNYLTFIESRNEIDILLLFYKLYRAYVRGKVESFLAQDPETSEDARLQASRTARQHFNLALGYLCPPMMILTCGLMGVGKTTVARKLNAVLGGSLLRSDEIRKELAGVSIKEKREEPFGKGIYSAELSSKTYDVLLDRTLNTLDAGKAAIADASFLRKKDREMFRAAAKRRGAPFVILHLECGKKIALERLDQRQRAGKDASDGRSALYDQQSAAFEHLDENGNVIKVDTQKDIDYNIHLILCEILKKTGINL